MIDLPTMGGVDMSGETKTNDEGGMWSRIGILEKQSAAQSTDIRGIYAGLEEIRDVLVRIQDNARPNLGGMFLALLATCTFLVTIGGLAMAPVYREQGRAYEALTLVMQTQNEMRANRFTSIDGDALEDRIRINMHRNEDSLYESRERLARMEGVLGIGLNSRRDE